jgi:hypothetical protein
LRYRALELAAKHAYLCEHCGGGEGFGLNPVVSEFSKQGHTPQIYRVAVRTCLDRTGHGAAAIQSNKPANIRPIKLCNSDACTMNDMCLLNA